MSSTVSNHDVKQELSQKGTMDIYTEDDATFTSTSVNAINTIIGAGILSIPLTIHNTGIVGSFFLLLTSLALSLCGAYYLIVASHYTKKDTYGEIANLLYGKGVKIVGNMTIIVYELGVSTAYFVILFEQALDLLHSWGKIESEFLYHNRYVMLFHVFILISSGSHM